MTDYLVRTVAKAAGLRIIACQTTQLAAEAARRHQSTPTATSALGRALTVAALSGALLKVQQRIAIKLTGDGPLQKIIVESDSYGKVRGYVAAPKVEVERQFGDIDVPSAIGNGEMYVVKDVRLKELIKSIVPLQSGGVDDDFTFYLNQSEQIPSLVQVGVKLAGDGSVMLAGGLIVQALGDVDATVVATIQERLEELPTFVDLLHAGETPESIVKMLYDSIEYDLLEKRDVYFHCGCSRKRSEAALISLGRAEIESLLEEGRAIVDCHFCHERYIFDEEDLTDLLARLSD